MRARQIPTTTLLASAFVAAVAVACEGATSERIDPAILPSGTTFRPVAEVLVDRCGSLDCHGSKYRNMHLFGYGSSRLDPAHQPDAPATTQDEVDRDFEAVVALEPELMRQVAIEGGRNPERLTFFRKARGAEAHKGGQRVVPGDAADVCIQSWLAGAVDADPCKAAVPRLQNP